MRIESLHASPLDLEDSKTTPPLEASSVVEGMVSGISEAMPENIGLLGSYDVCEILDVSDALSLKDKRTRVGIMRIKVHVKCTCEGFIKFSCKTASIYIFIYTANFGVLITTCRNILYKFLSRQPKQAHKHIGMLHAGLWRN